MDTVYIKIRSYSSLSKVILIIRKYKKNAPMGYITQAIEKGEKVLECDYLSLPGLRKIRKCYDELSKSDICCEIYDEEDELMSREVLDNMIQSYKQTLDEIQARVDRESSETK